jgi:uncharacterized protein (DUF433 family)
MTLAIVFTAEERADIIARYEAGESATALARAYHLSRGALTKRLKEWGLTIRRPVPEPLRIDREEIEDIEYLYWTCECSVAEIADVYGLTREAIRTRMVRRGIPLRSKSEAFKLAWARLTPEERTARVRKGWESSTPEQREQRRALLAQYSRLKCVPPGVD